MYSWPANHNSRPSTQHGKGNTKSKEKADFPNCPILDHGTLAAATLLENNGHLEWTSITTGQPKAPLKTGKSVTVFPVTRPAPLPLPKMTIVHRAEQGANFLRTFVPDVDIAADLIREQITADAKVLREFDDFDPYVGNQLESIILSDSATKEYAFLAFPMGELSRDLNISPLLLSENGPAFLKPCAQANRTFDTPIRQLSASKVNGPGRKQASYLAVRIFGSTSLLEVKSTVSRSTSEVRVKELGSVVSSDTGGKPVVDVKIASSPLAIILVNNQGALYKRDMGAGSKTMRLSHSAPSPTSADLFWRLELTESNDTCLLMSKVNLKELDFRTVDSSLDIYTALPNEVLTSTEDYPRDHMLRLCTTSQVVWFDRRNTVKPMLAFKHGRSFDRTLEAKTIPTNNGHLTTLSSRKNGFMSIYDITLSQDSMPYARASPYGLATSTMGAFQTGHCFLRHPLEELHSPLTFFRLSGVGSICASQLSTTDVGEAPFSWSEDVHRLNDDSAQLREDVSTFGSEKLSTLDMFHTYDHIFRAHSRNSQIHAEEAAESLYDLVEKAPSYWQDLNDPVDHILTTYDVLFRSGDEPIQSTRADFLSESVINSTRGYRAVWQGRASADSLKKDAPWNYDLTKTLSKFDTDASSDLRTIAEHLRRFDLTSDGERSAQSVRRESEAREQLALDLVLSRHIYSPHLFSIDGDSSRELEMMTKTLSLDGEPPPVSFGYLRPISTRESDEEKEDSMPMGVRLLLKDWDVGTDPRDFAYIDPYDGAPLEPAPIRRRRASPDRPIADTQRPPLIVTANQFELGPRFLSQDTKFQPQPQLLTGSQPIAVHDGLEEMSQDFMASTQILPGAYGGRPVIKKKVAKKRLGGF
ncbi:hypothetical protein C8R43DRAFT_990633 [Mycena crocata]|nr:hypothetical protein C8R43DRAFT_990633 [Mycena crocata]